MSETHTCKLVELRDAQPPAHCNRTLLAQTHTDTNRQQTQRDEERGEGEKVEDMVDRKSAQLAEC